MDDEKYYIWANEEYFTICRGDKIWSGVWSDMVIEQTLNRFFGTDLKHDICVTDGGRLLHKYVQQTNKTFEKIFDGYGNFIIPRFGKTATVMFDDYEQNNWY